MTNGDPLRDDPLRGDPLRDDPLSQAAAWFAAGEAVAVATVVETWNSAPRPVGSQMAISRAGRLAGSVSGGCVENAVQDAAQQVMEQGRPQLLRFGISNNNAWQVGLPCGGEIAVFIERLG